MTQNKCSKKRFSETQALIVLSRAQYRARVKNRHERAEQRSYFCDKCRAWHVTSQQGKHRRLS